MNIDMSAIKAFVTSGRGCFLGRPRLRLTVSGVVRSLGCSVGGSSVSLSSSVSGLVSIRKKGFTVVDRKLVGPLGNCTLQVSPLSARRLYGPVHFLLWPVLPLRQTSTSKLRGKSCTGVVSGPFRWRKALLTDLRACNLAISAIALRTAVARTVIEGAGGSKLVIRG